ncbi:hypothetical protein Tco_0375228 [Tanacetum coccineum]
MQYNHGTMKDSRKKIDRRVLDDALPLGRANGSRFMGMIRKEMDEEGKVQRKTFSQQGNEIRGHINSDSCGDLKFAQDTLDKSSSLAIIIRSTGLS